MKNSRPSRSREPLSYEERIVIAAYAASGLMLLALMGFMVLVGMIAAMIAELL